MSPRPDLSMTDTEVRDFLASQTRAVLGALDRGEPVGAVVGITLVGDHLRVRTDDPHLITLLALDDRVCVVADVFPDYYGIRGVVVHGRARDRTTTGATTTFSLPLDDCTSFDFARLPRTGTGSGKA